MNVYDEIERILEKNNKTINDIKCLSLQTLKKEFKIFVNSSDNEFGAVLCNMSNCNYDDNYGSQDGKYTEPYVRDKYEWEEGPE